MFAQEVKMDFASFQRIHWQAGGTNCVKNCQNEIFMLGDL